MTTTPERILDFWLREVGEGGWYTATEATDQAVRDRFGAAWEALRVGDLVDWLAAPQGALAYIILADQFPRNMFRGDPRAFATDALARDAARRALAAGHDLATEGPARQFFYMPFEHSESAADQDLAVRLMEERMSGDPELAHHARVHREIIRRFGRFPFRNAALGRATTAAEQDFLDAGGYPALVRAMAAAPGGGGHDGAA